MNNERVWVDQGERGMLQLKKEQLKSSCIAQDQYPRVVSGKEFGIYKRLQTIAGMTPVGNQLYLGRCTVHKKYYLDRKHTNGDIRCPICDAKWLRKRGFIK